ncbi:sugar phosphate isomerase/epimerase family protein [Candidatus Latescibacterota bacterium]
MRLCYNDWFGGPLRNITSENAKEIYDMGFRVVGVNSGDADATDEEIDRARNIILDTGLMPGPFGAGRTTFHPDPVQRDEMKKGIARVLRAAGKIGCPTIRISAGTMHPTNRWMHHPENHSQEAMDLFVENTRDLVKIAEDNACAICPETTKFTIIDSIERMKEFVDRLDSDYVKVVFDPVNHMTSDRVYDSGRFMKMAIASLGDRIGVIHVKDVMVQDTLLITHIDETEMGTGVLDHAALIKATNQLEPWKTFSFEHIQSRKLIVPALKHIQKVSAEIGHTWTDPKCTREKWLSGKYK